MRKNIKILSFILLFICLANLYAVLKCDKCGKNIETGIYYIIDKKNYCEYCYNKYFIEYCSVCGKKIQGKYNIDFWGNKFHEEHKKDHYSCEFCNRIICKNITNGGKIYNDGTHICNICFKTAILSQSQAVSLMSPSFD